MKVLKLIKIWLWLNIFVFKLESLWVVVIIFGWFWLNIFVNLDCVVMVFDCVFSIVWNVLLESSVRILIVWFVDILRMLERCFILFIEIKCLVFVCFNLMCRVLVWLIRLWNCLMEINLCLVWKVIIFVCVWCIVFLNLVSVLW